MMERRWWRGLAWGLAGLGLVIVTGCARLAAPGARETLYQTSTISALQEGVYDGQLSVGELTRRGDLGLGTFNTLDGEMIVLEGRVFQARADGKLYAAPADALTPFAAVTFFESDRAATLDNVSSLAELTRRLDALVGSPNLPYAIRIDGEFDYVRTRSVPAQKKPYPRLVEVARRQPEFELKGVRGTLVGFRLPEFVKGLNVPGYHLHFISADRTAGGHVLEVRGRGLRAQLDETPQAMVDLGRTAGLGQARLGADTHQELKEIE